jgi:hypothetical protein
MSRSARSRRGRPSRPLRLLLVLLALVFAFELWRPRRVDGPEVVAPDGARWSWELAVSSFGEPAHAWRLLRRVEGAGVEVVAEGPYEEVAGPVAGDGIVGWGFRRDGGWRLEQRLDSGIQRGQGMSDRLALEWALARGAAGLVPGDAAELSLLEPAAQHDLWPPMPPEDS